MTPKNCPEAVHDAIKALPSEEILKQTKAIGAQRGYDKVALAHLRNCNTCGATLAFDPGVHPVIDAESEKIPIRFVRTA